MTHVKYDKLDFDTIKSNLKQFLKSQEQFKDYNFEGSSLSILLDVLAYNTAYNGFYLNMLSSEMFLDSAAMRESIISRAKHLGYVPRSVNSLRATINISIDVSSVANPQGRIYINRDTEFTTAVDNKKYTFIPERSLYLELNSAKRYATTGLTLIQGTRLKHQYVIDLNAPLKQHYVIPNALVDLSTLVVTVKQSATNSAEEVFTQAKDINLLSPKLPVYFIQPYGDGLYEVVFGDGILGKGLETGNIVTLDYIASSGDGAKNAKTFVPAKLLSPDASGRTTITCTQAASNYVGPESNDSIKLVAPRAYAAQNRAVTKLDYETILKKDIPIIEHLRVWGGEENDPPIYGKVFCSIKPISGFELNTDDKKRLIDNYIKPRSILSLDVELVEPEYIYITTNTTVNYFADKTNKQDGDLKKIVVDGIKNFKIANLSGFDADFRHSKLVRTIDSLDSAIESNTTDVKIKYRLVPPFYTYFNKDITLNNAIDTGDAKNNNSAINSTEFIYKGTSVKLADDGLGKLYLYYTLNNTRVIVNNNVGTVDYANGKIHIENIYVDRIPRDQIYIDIFIKPKNDDVISLRNQILRLEEEDITVSTVNLNKIKLS